MHAVVGFTAHHVIAADVEPEIARNRLPADDMGAPLSAGFLLFLAGWVGAEPGTLDVVLAAPSLAVSGDMLEVWGRQDLEHHPRVQRAQRFRPDVTVYAECAGDEPDGVLVVGPGVAGRWEMAFEVSIDARGRGLGRRLARTARSLVPDGEPVFAQVAPGNVASLRACLAAGYQPIAAETLFVPH
jgi:hypothetical protein